MKRDFIDFFAVPDQQLDIHERLCNWARYVKPTRHTWAGAAIWRMGRSNSRQWHPPILVAPINTLDGHALEVAIRALPEPHREAIRWSYYYKTSPARARRLLGVTNEGLMRLVNDGRQMLINRAS